MREKKRMGLNLVREGQGLDERERTWRERVQKLVVKQDLARSPRDRLVFKGDCVGKAMDAGSRHVRLLLLEGCALLTTAGLEALVINWRDLHTLQVVYCNNIKDSEISPALALTFSTLKELKWRPDTRFLLADSLSGTGVGQIGGKFFKRGGPS
eukprot:c19998_g1_i2 orf=207-668(-)